VHHWGFPTRGAHHPWREIRCRRLAGPLRILSLGFFITGPWTSDLVLSEIVLWLRLFLEQWGELKRRRAFLKSRSSPFGGVTLQI
jgi:hypothetical protein